MGLADLHGLPNPVPPAFQPTVPSGADAGQVPPPSAPSVSRRGLREMDVAIRLISAKPALGPLTGLTLEGVSWVITGGESGGPPERALVETSARELRPKPAGLRWVREIRDLCRVEGVAFFHKQWGGRTPKAGGRKLDGREWSEYPVAVTEGSQR